MKTFRAFVVVVIMFAINIVPFVVVTFSNGTGLEIAGWLLAVVWYGLVTYWFSKIIN